MVELTENRLLSIVHRLIHLTAWAITAIVIHSLLLICLLLCLLLDISAQDIHAYFSALRTHWDWQALAATLGFLGISGAAALIFAAKRLKALIVDLSLRYLVLEIKRQNIQ